MSILDTIRRFLTPTSADDLDAPFLARYQLVDRAGQIYRESDVPVVFFEDGPAIAKAMLLNRVEPARDWRWVRVAR
jgi:hypothetical protein